MDDLVCGMIRLMDSPAEISGPMNLGNPEEFTIKELAGLVLEMTGSKSELIHHPLPVNDPVMRRPDITFAKEALGWEPSVRLQQGLLETINYFDLLLKSRDEKTIS